jgi:hypothetical protein
VHPSGSENISDHISAAGVATGGEGYPAHEQRWQRPAQRRKGVPPGMHFHSFFFFITLDTGPIKKSPLGLELRDTKVKSEP